MAATLASSKSKSFVVFLLITVASFSALADNGPAQILTNALLCFNNKFIYNRCNEAYRLNQSGDLNVPPEATDQFCNGACLSETQGLLNCLDNIFSNFMFYNKATIGDIRGTLRGGCSYTNQRGVYNIYRIVYILNLSSSFSDPSKLTFLY
ncbi:hypothetical protein TEA_022259 [Camellia sinensis var. sinensis]|uniref:DUF7731 domain-containing protein n=1 Tax=Camellia sinensis var. sinensis TaxID=542762 RepID=A0A4S4E1B0_CAMSN|nr:hypothetical protein TEA_022259 [Camellia sinensis var. sinensis]